MPVPPRVMIVAIVPAVNRQRVRGKMPVPPRVMIVAAIF